MNDHDIGGEVLDVSFQPAADGAVHLIIWHEPDGMKGASHARLIWPDDDEAQVTFDGSKVNGFELLSALVRTKRKVAVNVVSPKIAAFATL